MDLGEKIKWNYKPYANINLQKLLEYSQLKLCRNI